MSRKIYIIIAMVFTVVLSVSTFFIIRNHIDSAKQIILCIKEYYIGIGKFAGKVLIYFRI